MGQIILACFRVRLHVEQTIADAGLTRPHGNAVWLPDGLSFAEQGCPFAIVERHPWRDDETNAKDCTQSFWHGRRVEIESRRRLATTINARSIVFKMTCGLLYRSDVSAVSEVCPRHP